MNFMLVDDPAQVLREAYRMLKPGGTYFFLEHVASPAGATNHRVQRLLFRPHRWLFNGCEVTRNTEATIRSGPFDAVEVDEVDRGRGALWVRDQIVGPATKAASQ